jgi:hypothetical protein
MRYNWTRRWELRNFPLNELFEGCGLDGMTEKERVRYKIFGTWGLSRIRKACLAYNGKIMQALPLKELIGEDMAIVDYDDLVQEKHKILSSIYDFLCIPFRFSYGGKIHSSSVSKADRLSEKEKRMIGQICSESYITVKKMADDMLNS